jgi:hypothetical protein
MALVSVRRTPLVDPAGPAGAELGGAPAGAGAEPVAGFATDSAGTAGVGGTEGGRACSNVVSAGFGTLGTLGRGAGGGVGAGVGIGATADGDGLAGAGCVGCGERSVA